MAKKKGEALIVATKVKAYVKNGSGSITSAYQDLQRAASRFSGEPTRLRPDAKHAFGDLENAKAALEQVRGLITLLQRYLKSID
jgi:hypothetical protein